MSLPLHFLRPWGLTVISDALKELQLVKKIDGWMQSMNSFNTAYKCHVIPYV